jgi:hypothetical protein
MFASNHAFALLDRRQNAIVRLSPLKVRLLFLDRNFTVLTPSFISQGSPRVDAAPHRSWARRCRR